MRRMIQGDDSSETVVIQGRRSGPRYTAFAFPSAAIMSLIGFLSRPFGPIRAAPDAPLQIQPDPPRALHRNPAAHHLRDAQFGLFQRISQFMPSLQAFLHLSIAVVSLIVGLVFTPSSFSE
ncbi:hypothetical protein ROHU_012054 [Labeo rohita]|uniref:Uncharacterized protein n=1 Tax=Labeo rohita TaxID=84645 RepID=A0A498LJ15_LABRO|nr:hypothetical protein ROHU_012054 [Labeo rohita]